MDGAAQNGQIQGSNVGGPALDTHSAGVCGNRLRSKREACIREPTRVPIPVPTALCTQPPLRWVNFGMTYGPPLFECLPSSVLSSPKYALEDPDAPVFSDEDGCAALNYPYMVCWPGCGAYAFQIRVMRMPSREGFLNTLAWHISEDVFDHLPTPRVGYEAWDVSRLLTANTLTRHVYISAMRLVNVNFTPTWLIELSMDRFILDDDDVWPSSPIDFETRTRTSNARHRPIETHDQQDMLVESVRLLAQPSLKWCWTVAALWTDPEARKVYDAMLVNARQPQCLHPCG